MKKEAFDLGLLFISLIAWNFFLSVVVSGFQKVTGSELPWWAGEILLESINVLIVFIYLDKHHVNIWNSLGFRMIRPFTIVKVVILSYLVEQIATFVNLLSQLVAPNEVAGLSGELMEGSFIGTFFVIAILAPLYEEICFRSVFFNRYKMITSVRKAVVFSGLLFGLFHLNLNQFAYAFVLGIYFALVNEACGSVWPSFLIHASINGSNVLLMKLLSSMTQTPGQKMVENILQNSAVNTTELIKPMLGNAGFYALTGFLISMPLLVSIARGEDRESAFLDIFVKREAGAAEAQDRVWSLPTIAAVIFCVGYMIVLLL